jgi:hypothetical protein
MRRSLPTLVALSVAAAAGMSARTAGAGEFTPEGAFTFDAAAVATNDFEAAPGDGGAETSEDASALSGQRILVLTSNSGVDLPLSLPKEARTYRVSVWVRGRETIADLELSYSDRVDEIAALYPTGRVTSDGWVELANERIRVDGARLTSATLGLFAPGGAEVDAVEVVADGELDGLVNAPCAGATDASACGTGQICVWNECRNVAGWVPPIPADRNDVADYLANRIRLLFGPYIERTIELPNANVALEQMRLAQDPWAYWNGFMLAVRRLHDGHTSTSGLADFVLRNPRPLSLCFLEGEADLSHGIAPKDPQYLDVLVSHTGGDHNLDLRAGDRLVAVDGVHPIAWARSLVEINWAQPAISNRVTYAELASSLRAMISRYANRIDVIRCDSVDDSCGPVESISIAELPFDAPQTPVDMVACDNRPKRHLAQSPANHATGQAVFSGLVLESDDQERIYGLEWESLYTTNGTDGVGADLDAAVATWRDEGARGVILDHRTGHGGTMLAPMKLWDYVVPRHASNFYQDRQRADDEQPTLAEGLTTFEEALSAGWVDFVGSSNPVKDVPVALLLTEDISASDWLPLGMKGAPSVRIFAPFQTNGGFSTRYSFGYWLGLSFTIAVGDTFLPDGSTHNGRGVEPDEIVLPRQSDLVHGKDSVYEAALAWVRQELKP